MKFDLHTHHYRCGHAQGQIKDYIDRRLSAGFSGIWYLGPFSLLRKHRRSSSARHRYGKK